MHITCKFLILLSVVATVYGLDNGLALTPPMGWLSWERYTCEIDCDTFPNDCINENLYMRMADLLVSEGYKDVGYEYVNIDDCWPQVNRGPQGELLADPKRFPSGIKALADYVHAKGLKLGIYLDIGTETCGGYPGFNVTTDDSNTRYIDDINLLASWGIDSLKVDGCYASVDTMGVTYPKLGKALNQTGRPILYSCSWPAYAQGEGKTIPYAQLVEYCNIWRNYDDISDSYDSIQHIINFWISQNANLTKYPQPGAFNDPDMIMVGGTGLSTAQEEMQMAIWSIVAGPLLMSNDLSKVSVLSKAILQNTEVIAVSQDKLGKAGCIVLKASDYQVWTRPLANGDVAVVLANPGNFGGPVLATFNSSVIGLSTEVFSARNLFTHQDLGLFRTFKGYVTTSSVIMLRVSPSSEKLPVVEQPIPTQKPKKSSHAPPAATY